MSSDDTRSSIKFGSYDEEGIMEGEVLKLVRTNQVGSWMLKAKDFRFGLDDTIENINGTRMVHIEPSSPFIYAPAADFLQISRKFLFYYQNESFSCNYDRNTSIYSCHFDQPCEEARKILNKDADFQATVFDDFGGSFDFKLEENKLLIDGNQMYHEDPSKTDKCYIPILYQNVE